MFGGGVVIEGVSDPESISEASAARILAARSVPSGVNGDEVPAPI